MFQFYGVFFDGIIGVYFDVYYVNFHLQQIPILNNILGYFCVVFRTYFLNFLYLLLNVFGSNNMYYAQLEVALLVNICILMQMVVHFII